MAEKTPKDIANPANDFLAPPVAAAAREPINAGVPRARAREAAAPVVELWPMPFAMFYLAQWFLAALAPAAVPRLMPPLALSATARAVLAELRTWPVPARVAAIAYSIDSGAVSVGKGLRELQRAGLAVCAGGSWTVARTACRLSTAVTPEVEGAADNHSATFTSNS